VVPTLTRPFGERMAGEQHDGPGDACEPGGQAEEPPPAMKSPALPVIQSMTKPRDLLPGISIVTITPAARPGTIYAHDRLLC
jgi:hypothetical protein